MSQAPSFCDVVSARSEKYHADFAVPDSAYLYEREIAEVGASCVFAICIPDGVASGQYLERWVYAPVNFLVPAEVERLDKLMRNAKSLGTLILAIRN